MDRRAFLYASTSFASLSLAACARKVAVAPPPASPLPFYDALAPILPIRAHMDRIFRITVCLRPFRAAGPRLDTERVGDKLVVHNYGHGGSGWSLSWGSADFAVRKVPSRREQATRDVAVIGCGALGLTAALTAQRAGLRVTIYAKERPPFVRSSNATGSWTPDSRVALTSDAPATFAADWEAMARRSFTMYQSFLGMPGNPIEWTDRYSLSDRSPEESGPRRQRLEAGHSFARYQQGRIADLDSEVAGHSGRDASVSNKVCPPDHFVDVQCCRLFTPVDERFLRGGRRCGDPGVPFAAGSGGAASAGGAFRNCTGYGARQLWSDESIVPVRGQIAWLIPQEGVNYGLNFGDLNVLARRDGIVVQPSPQGEETGWNDSNEQPDRAEAEAGVRELQELYARMEKTPSHG